MLLYNYTTFLLVYSAFNNEYVQKNIKSGVFDTKPPNKGQPLYKGQKVCPRGWPLFGGSTVDVLFSSVMVLASAAVKFDRL